MEVEVWMVEVWVVEVWVVEVCFPVGQSLIRVDYQLCS